MRTIEYHGRQIMDYGTAGFRWHVGRYSFRKLSEAKNHVDQMILWDRHFLGLGPKIRG